MGSSGFDFELPEVRVESPLPVSTSSIQTLEQLRNSQHIYGSCDEVPSNSSGVYRIYANLDETAVVYCDQEYEGGGWTVVMNRFDGSVCFDRPRNKYLGGFGRFDSGEFMMGLNLLYLLTNLAPHEMVVLFEDFSGASMKSRADRFILNEGQRISTDSGLNLEDFSSEWSDNKDPNNTIRFNLFGYYRKGNVNAGPSDMRWADSNNNQFYLKSCRIMIRKTKTS